MSDWLFGPDSMMWKINRESVLLIGGRASLLMQLAHPLVAAGVADHSDFQKDGIARLRRTLDSMLSIAFGTEAEAREVLRRIAARHAEVKGTGPDGRSYSAKDPTLMLWVWATLVDSSVRVYEACVGTLSGEERARYYEECRVTGRLFGVRANTIPSSLDDMRGWMKDLIASGEVVVTPQARELAAAILRPVPVVPLRVAEASSFVTAALLPRPIREGYGLKLGPSRSAALALGRLTSKRLLPLVPGPLRTFPAARAAGRG